MAVKDTCELGGVTYELAPQRHARIWRALPEVIAQAGDLGELELDDPGAVVLALGDRVRDVLAVFIPDLMPAWQFNGFGSEPAMHAAAYDAQADRSPTLPEIVEAFELAWRVNGMHRISKALGKLLGPELAKPIRTLIATNVTQMVNSPSSLRSAPESGESASTTSTASSPTIPAGLSA